MSLQLQPVRLASGNDDTEGQLVFIDGSLAAVLVHLSDVHGDEAGMWFLEAWFGVPYRSNHPTFASLDKAQDWIEGQLVEV